MRTPSIFFFTGLSSLFISLSVWASEHGAAHGAGGFPKVVYYQALNISILFAFLIWFAGPKVKAFFKNRYEDFMRQATEAEKLMKELEGQKADLIRRMDQLRQTSAQSIESSKVDAEKNFISEIEKARAGAIKMNKDASNLLIIDEQKLTEKLRLEALGLAVASAEDQLKSAGSSEKGQFNNQFHQRVEGASV